MSTRLQIAEPTGRFRRSLRRFTFSETMIDGKVVHPDTSRNCSARGWGCNASVVIGEVAKGDHERVHGDNWPRDDPRWPAVCEHCGQPFRESEPWQRNDDELFALPDGKPFTLDDPDAPVGACVRMDWADDFYDNHPQGIKPWFIVLPRNGLSRADWITAQSAVGGGFWTVDGDMPNITVTPSIFYASPVGWHGWIRNGELVDA